MIDDNTFKFDSLSPIEMMRTKLKNQPIPVCKSDNNVESQYQEMLAQKLHFPRELAKIYGSVLCRFFDGLQKEYGSPATSNFHDAFRIRGSHNYFRQDDDRFDALEELASQEFDSKFFEWIMNEFTK